MATVPSETVHLTEVSLSNFEVYEADVLKALIGLNPNKAYGCDGVSPRILKQMATAIAKPLTSIFNKSLAASKFPSIWKQANVIPLHKKEARTDPSNYRPVSLLCCLSKVFERMVFNALFKHFKDNFLLSVWQSGFIPGASTTCQLVELYHEFCKGVSNGKEVRVIFCDISKAFDRVWHNGLIFKLEQNGICGSVLTWLKHYLKDRKQHVLVNGQQSIWGNIKAGVPQGSVLGPLLFLIYINDIVHVINYCKIRLFADDTCLYIIVDNTRQEAAIRMNKDLESINNWAKTCF